MRLLSTSACLFWASISVSISVSNYFELLWFRVNAGEPKALQYRTYWTSVNAAELYGTASHASPKRRRHNRPLDGPHFRLHISASSQSQIDIQEHGFPQKKGDSRRAQLTSTIENFLLIRRRKGSNEGVFREAGSEVPRPIAPHLFFTIERPMNTDLDSNSDSPLSCTSWSHPSWSRTSRSA